MKPCNPKEWYWQVGDDTSRFWSSAAKAYVSASPADQMSRIANEVELYDVLVKAKAKSSAPTRTFTVAEIRAAFVHIDASLTGNANDAVSLAAVADEMGFSLPPIA